MPAALDLARDMARPAVRSMLLGSTALTRFAVNGVEAALALDFIASEYRMANTATTFAKAFMGNSPKLTYNPGSASSSQSTMVNSSGEIVWAPHNLLDYSEDFSQTVWGKNNTTETPDAVEAPDGTTTAYKIEQTASGDWRIIHNIAPPSGSYTFKVWLRTVSGTGTIGIRIYNGGTFQDTLASLTEEWQSFTVSHTGTTINCYVDNRVTGSNLTECYIWGAHVYRSDLGGMAPVPGAVGDFQYYVPTNGNAEYLPRVGHHVYNGSTWVNEGLLIESEPRTNLVTYSEDFSHSSWTATKLEVGALVAGPDGASNVATTLTATDPSSSYTHKIDVRDVAPDPQTGTNTASIFVKQGTNRYVVLTQEWSSNFTYAVYDLEDGVVTETGSGGTGSYVSSTMEPSGNGFWRISLSGSIGTSGSDAFVLLMSHTGTPNRRDPVFTASGTETIYIYGVQLEAGSTPSSYIPTNGSTVTRGGQSLTVPPAEFGWDSSAVSIQMDGRMTYADGDVGVSSDGTSGEVLFSRWRVGASEYITSALATNTGTGEVVFIQEVGGVFDTARSNASDYTPGINVPFNIASRHGSTFVNGAVDGVALTADTTPTALPDLSNTNLEIAYDFMGTIGTFRQFAGDIGDAGLVTATKPSTEPTLSLTFDGTEGSFYNLNWSE